MQAVSTYLLVFGLMSKIQLSFSFKQLEKKPPAPFYFQNGIMYYFSLTFKDTLFLLTYCII